MTEFTREEAAAFIEALRLAIDGKVGFKWLSERMSGLAAYVDGLAEENERLRERVAGMESEVAGDPSGE